jgi:hypothetical protein
MKNRIPWKRSNASEREEMMKYAQNILKKVSRLF